MTTLAPDRPVRVRRRGAVRWVRLGGIVALAGLAAYVVAELFVFVFPPTGPLPKHADVALVLGVDTPQRIALARSLLADGTVDEMLWSAPPQTDGHVDPAVARLCGELSHLTCFVPDPDTTQGEARELRAQAAQRGWTSAIVITQAAHALRAHLIVGRCFGGAITMAPSGEGPSWGWPYQYLYQTAATVRAWRHPGC